jgi:superkiller protein 3
VILATALVHLHPPKHHARASRILDDVLTRDPGHANALMARAYILQYAKDWDKAAKLFRLVLKETADDDSPGWVRARAREEVAWCLAMAGDLEGGLDELKEVSEVLEAGEAPLEDRARVEWRLGKCMWELGGQLPGSICYYQPCNDFGSQAPGETNLTNTSSPPSNKIRATPPLLHH